ncbi:hypothetical protein LTR36_001328 [Oleoguttula mirabilis]|uniref:Uncharacterized protein n=1 Tax=Oleoguttula mirabilis TaxID=1507867 RepID=A0AAV9JNW6_9PEZI|nr:hypothetical protein LTR36_001328 [Oleoguttula mirabilis]
MARLPRISITHGWRLPKLVIALMVVEFFMTVGCLTLYGIADPDTYRTRLWQNGYDKGFNSAPSEILYSYANYRPIHVPMIWSSALVQFNIVIAVFSMFVLLVKTTMYILHTWIPLISVFVHILEVSLYAVSVKHQTTPDMSDSDHPSPGLPWYLSKGCKYAESGNYGFCMQARAAFAVTCVMVALFSSYLILSIWSLFPTKAELAEREADRTDPDIEMKKVVMDSPESEMSQEDKWERNRQIFLNLPKTPNTAGFGANNPTTPRTVAFTQLNGGPGPSRQQGPAGGLKFREQYADGKVPDGR